MDDNPQKRELVNFIQEPFAEAIQRAFPNDSELPQHVQALMQAGELLSDTRNASTDDIQLAIDFVNEGIRDVDSCNALWKRNIYPHAVYHLQQAVEKGAKAYMLGFGFLKKADLLTHNTPDLFFEVFLKKGGLKSYAAGIEDENLKDRFDKAYEPLRDRSMRDEIIRTPYHGITEQMRVLQDTNQKSDEMIQSVVVLLERFTGIGMDERIPLYRALPTVGTLFIFGALTFPHESCTRYPDQSIKPEDYTKDMGIVRAIPKLLKVLKPELIRLREIICKVIGDQQ